MSNSTSSLVVSNKTGTISAPLPVASAEEEYNAKMEQLRGIINKYPIKPEIKNDKSKFVVVTYWWGKGNLNRNLARPCMSFYEDLLIKPFEFLSNLGISIDSLSDKHIQWFRIVFSSRKDAAMQKYYKKKLTDYILERRASVGNRRGRNNFEVSNDVKDIIKKLFPILNNLLNDADELIRELIATPKTTKEYNDVMTKIKQKARGYITNPDGLISVMEYKAPVNYDTMIANWEATCEHVGCNYMAVEYPEFAQKGGYQLAINAKPMFIQKALAACAPRAVVYIDGDMTVNFYPSVFDIDNIDYMARNWHIDPRSSWKHSHGEISVDPYTFETSGGIMYFSQSPESQKLLGKWVDESAKFVNSGKADDRIISLIFNSYRLLAPMKIIQLPVEFLWLSLDYDDTIEDEWKDESKIYVEHPECLTSEDTAASSGAASSRQPKYYEGIENVLPRAETIYERVMFPSVEIRDNFAPWLNYVGSVEYQDEYLEDDLKELAGYNPFGVIKMEEGFGTMNEVVEKNNREAQEMTNTYNASSGFVVLNEESFYIPIILKNLRMGRTIYYKPLALHPGKRAYFEQFIRDTRYERIEFAFFDTGKRLGPNFVFNYDIDMEQPILLRPGNPVLEMMISLMPDIEAFKNVFKSGYQFLSLIRCYVMKGVRVSGGGVGGQNSTQDRSTEDAIGLLYGGGRSQRRRVQTMKHRKQRRRYSRKN